MPHRLLWTPLSAGQTFLRLQLPFLCGVLFFSVALALEVPTLRDSFVLWFGVAVTGAASMLFLLPGRRWLSTGWVVVIPLLDIVGIAAVRAALVPYLPTIGMLCLFPFAWIAYRFRWPALLLVFVSGVAIAALPFALGGRPITTLLAFINVSALPLIATGISVGIHLGAVSFRRGRERVEDAGRRLQALLEKSQDDELLLRSTLDTVTGAVAFYDANNQLVLANSAAEQMVDVVGFRLDTPPYAGSNVLMADRKTTIPFDEQIIPRALRGEVIASHLEWLGKPGNQIAILASSRRVHRADGMLLGTVIAAYDVTELANAIEIREEFLTTVSHELRTPLTSIIGFTDEIIDTLGDRAHDLGVAAYLETVSRNADLLLDRVGELLTAADKRIELTIEETDIATLLDQVTGPLRLSAERAGIALEVEVPPGLTAVVDPARITQAVENLLTNAIKFTARGGTVTVRARRDDAGDLHISVSDTGIGMTPDEQRRVFDRFYRAQAVRRNAIQGIGVGLSIVKAIVDAHRGRVTVDSEQGVGTTIALCLPVGAGRDA
ncbi:sensor histidine kinase [Microbacterium imperiale]|uniref:histidine kinase n=1 Tax=Microbacterium imperiale TaxID=33884 RepID=A0A9W6HIJ0_9MICO|nr:HAMP domain-containing sensor histidine kinase [Microbacterium imperiale]MBP2421163.1 signal transduction histidine kinase [Microbacterium imperiale]MDS0199725.1 HAMP domain-containing histidine kinase [Microbacterium imperiale]BFE41503.1 sensor histidine kinase [Microbacterium imperiale]GLJ80453.1 two-component sensor histidine kinase [Microbacterium imperiale]